MTSIPDLRSTRLTLRPYRANDFDEFAALNADENVRRYVGGALTTEMAKTRFADFLSGETLPGCGVWAITRTGTNEYIGHCWFTNQVNCPHPEIGFLVATRHWNRGYATEAAKLLLKYASTTSSHRIVATVDEDNTASIRVLEKAGMKREGEEVDEEGKHFLYVFDIEGPEQNLGSSDHSHG